MFGDYVKWYFEFPTPDENISPQFVLTTIDQAHYKSMHSPKGPVHINCMVREPLAPVKTKMKWTSTIKTIAAWQKSNLVYSINNE